MSSQNHFQTSPERRVQEFATQHFPFLETQIERLQGDASTRIYFRLRANGTSFIAAVYSEPVDHESPFISLTSLFDRGGIAVPQIHKLNGDWGIMLLEDLGDVRLQDVLPSFSAEQRKAVYQQATELILDIQKTTPTAIAENSIAARLAFDEEKLFWELNFFYENYFVNYLQQRPDAGTETLLLGEFSALAQRLARAPRVLCHRDYHSRNLMWHHNHLVVIDHQDARMGPATYDLVSLLGDPYAALDESLQSEMMALFWNRHAHTFGNRCYTSYREFENEYRLMMVQRMIKAIGTFSHQAAIKQNPVYLEYIPLAFETTARALETVADLPFTRRMVTTALGRS